VINLQDPRERLRYERAPGTLAAELEARKDRRLVICIDEIQKVPSLLDDIQYLFDRFPARFEFFVTGSSAGASGRVRPISCQGGRILSPVPGDRP